MQLPSIGCPNKFTLETRMEFDFIPKIFILRKFFRDLSEFGVSGGDNICGNRIPFPYNVICWYDVTLRLGNQWPQPQQQLDFVARSKNQTSTSTFRWLVIAAVMVRETIVDSAGLNGMQWPKAPDRTGPDRQWILCLFIETRPSFADTRAYG